MQRKLTEVQRLTLRDAARHPRGHVPVWWGDSRTHDALLRKGLIVLSHTRADSSGVYKITNAGRAALAAQGGTYEQDH